MKNFIQPGNHVTVICPSGGTVSGRGVIIGTLFGVAITDASAGDAVELCVQGVVEIAKTSALAISVGDRLFWDDTSKVVNKTAAAQVCVGVAVADAVNPSPTVLMLLGARTPSGT